MRGSSPLYPYKDWTDGEWHEIHPSDFGKPLANLRATFQQWAKNNRYRLITRTVDSDTMALCFKRAPRG